MYHPPKPDATAKVPVAPPGLGLSEVAVAKLWSLCSLEHERPQLRDREVQDERGRRQRALCPVGEAGNGQRVVARLKRAVRDGQRFGQAIGVVRRNKLVSVAVAVLEDIVGGVVDGGCRHVLGEVQRQTVHDRVGLGHASGDRNAGRSDRRSNAVNHIEVEQVLGADALLAGRQGLHDHKVGPIRSGRDGVVEAAGVAGRDGRAPARLENAQLDGGARIGAGEQGAEGWGAGAQEDGIAGIQGAEPVVVAVVAGRQGAGDAAAKAARCRRRRVQRSGIAQAVVGCGIELGA